MMPPQINKATAEQLASFFRRADNLYEERDRIAADLKELWKEAKGLGFDAKAIDRLVKERRKDPENETLKQSVVDTYIHALALDETPLGEWARERMNVESTMHTQAILATQQVTSDKIVNAFAAAHGLTVEDKADSGADRVEQIGLAHGMPREVIEAVRAP